MFKNVSFPLPYTYWHHFDSQLFIRETRKYLSLNQSPALICFLHTCHTKQIKSESGSCSRSISYFHIPYKLMYIIWLVRVILLHYYCNEVAWHVLPAGKCSLLMKTKLDYIGMILLMYAACWWVQHTTKRRNLFITWLQVSCLTTHVLPCFLQIKSGNKLDKLCLLCYVECEMMLLVA